MKLQFCGAARTVTGSCYFIDTGITRFLIDCGAFQGYNGLDVLNRKDFPFDPAQLDFVLLTHAHFDHTGRLPRLIQQGFKGKIISTQPTKELTQIVLMDAAKLQEEEYERWQAKLKQENFKGGKEDRWTPHSEYETWQLMSPEEVEEDHEPLFTEDDVHQLMDHFEIYPYDTIVEIAKGIEFRMRDAGHILGSAMYEVWVENELGRKRKIVFSGDLGQPGQRIIRDPDMIREADYVICESTYGNREHKNKDETLIEFLAIIKQALSEQGNILIPSFAIERTQEIIYELNLFFENKLLTNLPVFLDSPMAKKATEVFAKYPDFYDIDAKTLLEKGDDPFSFKGFSMIESVDESRRLVAQKGAIIIAGSGMCNGGRILHHLANNLEKKNTHVVFVGFQVEGTLGRKLVDMEPTVRIKGKQVDVHAKIHTLNGFSGHGDINDLKYWLRGFGHSPRRVFLTHGEEKISLEFAENVKKDLQVDTYVPHMEEMVELE